MENHQKLVSVIMSVKDGSKTLELAIRSITEQSYRNFEFLIIDDASIDDTNNILQRFSKKDTRIKIYKNEKNLGLTKSLNKLINLSSGEYIARQDADDYSVRERISTQIHLLEKLGADAVTSRAKIISNSKKIPGLSFYIPVKLARKYKNPFIHGTLLIKKDVINKIGNYDENFLYSQDFKLFNDLLKSGYKVKNLNKFLYHINMDDNISKNKTEEQKYYFDCVRKNLNP